MKKIILTIVFYFFSSMAFTAFAGIDGIESIASVAGISNFAKVGGITISSGTPTAGWIVTWLDGSSYITDNDSATIDLVWKDGVPKLDTGNE